MKHTVLKADLLVNLKLLIENENYKAIVHNVYNIMLVMSRTRH